MEPAREIGGHSEVPQANSTRHIAREPKNGQPSQVSVEHIDVAAYERGSRGYLELAWPLAPRPPASKVIPITESEEMDYRIGIGENDQQRIVRIHRPHITPNESVPVKPVERGAINAGLLPCTICGGCERYRDQRAAHRPDGCCAAAAGVQLLLVWTAVADFAVVLGNRAAAVTVALEDGVVRRSRRFRRCSDSLSFSFSYSSWRSVSPALGSGRPPRWSRPLLATPMLQPPPLFRKQDEVCPETNRGPGSAVVGRSWGQHFSQRCLPPAVKGGVLPCRWRSDLTGLRPCGTS